MKTLTIPVNKAAFDMLADPNPETRKNEEYRTATEFWVRRFLRFNSYGLTEDPGVWAEFIDCLANGCRGYQDLNEMNKCFGAEIKQFDLIKFTNGYGHKVPSVTRGWKGLDIGKPNSLWVPKGFLDLDKNYIRIQLGEIKPSP